MTDLEAPLIEKHGEKAVEAVCETISEMMWERETSHGEEGADGSVWISDQQMINACNHIATGSFWLGGAEYAFEVENGNNNGFMFRHLSEDGPIPDIEIHHTVWDVEPLDTPICDTKQKARFFLAKFDLLRKRDDVREIIRAYSYDRTFQPGAQIESHYRDKAARLGFRLTSKECADDWRSAFVHRHELAALSKAQGEAS